AGRHLALAAASSAQRLGDAEAVSGQFRRGPSGTTPDQRRPVPAERAAALDAVDRPQEVEPVLPTVQVSQEGLEEFRVAAGVDDADGHPAFFPPRYSVSPAFLAFRSTPSSRSNPISVLVRAAYWPGSKTPVRAHSISIVSSRRPT